LIPGLVWYAAGLLDAGEGLLLEGEAEGDKEGAGEVLEAA